ncbi:MAG TPA: MYXO-CTERM sorting domain-containing protein [Phycisphaerae bacterium]|nr:hypothetical protein [Phycisphaerae bacterium]HOB74675.1 MYXO-CTERM sorting domain-containing protein [Phycisphaerae bacterium]HOJ53612.1 MYXO-CTERM sorting domain-containing protein [Phycisphaerae bacterium]HOL26337.1 MYXO-CTERM sorting domain-containing protein [Phycisphaerae bacterium]HPP22510.1 MYXO-CTERM sorting domain-containing protein [Phycisphaerae bacterium]
MKMRAILGFAVLGVLGSGSLLQADLATPSVGPTISAKPSTGSSVQLTRLMPSYTMSYLASLGTAESNRAIAERSAGAVHLASGQVFYAQMLCGPEVVKGDANAGMGPGGDGSADTSTLPPPATVAVPVPGAAGLALLGLALVSARRRGR